MTDKKPMPVPGDHQAARDEAARGASGVSGGGDSGGGAYPNPHTGKADQDDAGSGGGFMGHGGQSDIDYHGPGQLGDETVDGRAQPNSAKDDE